MTYQNGRTTLNYEPSAILQCNQPLYKMEGYEINDNQRNFREKFSPIQNNTQLKNQPPIDPCSQLSAFTCGTRNTLAECEKCLIDQGCTSQAAVGTYCQGKTNQQINALATVRQRPNGAVQAPIGSRIMNPCVPASLDCPYQTTLSGCQQCAINDGCTTPAFIDQICKGKK